MRCARLDCCVENKCTHVIFNVRELSVVVMVGRADSRADGGRADEYEIIMNSAMRTMGSVLIAMASTNDSLNCFPTVGEYSNRIEICNHTFVTHLMIGDQVRIIFDKNAHQVFNKYTNTHTNVRIHAGRRIQQTGRTIAGAGAFSSIRRRRGVYIHFVRARVCWLWNSRIGQTRISRVTKHMLCVPSSFSSGVVVVVVIIIIGLSSFALIRAYENRHRHSRARIC